MSTALNPEPTPKELVQATLKTIERQRPSLAPAAIAALSLLESNDSLPVQWIIDEIQTQGSITHDDEIRIRAALKVLAIHGLVWELHGLGERYALTELVQLSLDPSRER